MRSCACAHITKLADAIYQGYRFINSLSVFIYRKNREDYVTITSRFSLYFMIVYLSALAGFIKKRTYK